MTEVAGIDLKQLKTPIHDALKSYEDISEGRLQFDAGSAADLELTPDKSNSARSATDFRYLGEQAGKLYVIAFKPGDGSGDESNYSLEDLTVAEPYPRTSRVVPRSKRGIHSEGHLTVVRQKIDSPQAEPELFAGTFDLLGLDGLTIKKIGELGHAATISAAEMTPLTTLTVSYRPHLSGTIERVGDPHAVYSSVPDALQVCAFLAVSDELYKQHPDMLASLKPQAPRPA